MMKLFCAIALAVLAFAASAQEDQYPSKPIHIIVPLTAGSGPDIAGRIIGQRLSEHWKQPVVVENRPGAGGQIGTAAVAKAEADGHTLLVQSSAYAANPAIYKSLPYDPQKDLADVAILGRTPYVMVAAGNGPYKSLKDVIAAAKAKPGAIPFASAGVGTSTHLAAEYLTALAGIKMLHVPFKGSPDAIQDVLGGRSAFYMAPLDVAMGLLKDRKLNPLGVSTKSRIDHLPDVPTIAEEGLPDYDITLWFGMWAPAATPIPIVQKLNAAVNAIVFEPAVKEQFGKLGIEAAPMKPDDFSKFVRSQMDFYKKIAARAGLQPQ
jgi:tripartite-type tricarboxylate transporter receptor subunit TctC